MRALRPSDLEAFLAYRSDPEIARYQGWSDFSRDEARGFIDSMQDVNGPRAGSWVQLGIALKNGDLLVGDIGLHIGKDGHAAQIGYSCARAYQRQGLASEAVGLVIEKIRTHTGCQWIHAIVDSRNAASERLLVRLGFEVSSVQSTEDVGGECAELTYALPLPTGRATGKAGNSG